MLTVLTAVQEGPAPEDVKAGWVALIIFLLLAVAVALLGFSLFKHLRISRESQDRGLYGDSTDPSASSASPPAKEDLTSSAQDDPSTSTQDDSPAPGGPTQSS